MAQQCALLIHNWCGNNNEWTIVIIGVILWEKKIGEQKEARQRHHCFLRTIVKNHTNQIIQSGMHFTIPVHVLLYVPCHTELSNNRQMIPSLCEDILHVVINNNKNQHTPHAEGGEMSPAWKKATQHYTNSRIMTPLSSIKRSVLEFPFKLTLFSSNNINVCVVSNYIYIIISILEILI